MTGVSIIICCYNASKRITPTLRHLQKQSFREPINWEVIIIDNASTDQTADIAKQYKLNFETAYNVARPLFVQMMKQNNGRIFIIGSKPGLSSVNSKGMVAYGLAKSLIFRLAELMNAEAKGTNVVISVIVPSTIDTPQNRKSMPDADPDKWVKPEAIADVIYFYCSDAAAVLREPVIKVYNNS